MRQAVAVVAGAGAAVLGALILGEYEFSGVLPLVMGVLFELAEEVGLAHGDRAVGHFRLAARRRGHRAPRRSLRRRSTRGRTARRRRRATASGREAGQEELVKRALGLDRS